MSTTDEVLLIVLSCLLSIFFIMLIALAFGIMKLIKSLQRVVEKAEDVVESVESAAEVFKDTQGRLAMFKLIRNIIKLAQRSRK